jgi:hypothetical protein
MGGFGFGQGYFGQYALGGTTPAPAPTVQAEYAIIVPEWPQHIVVPEWPNAVIVPGGSEP